MDLTGVGRLLLIIGGGLVVLALLLLGLARLTHGRGLPGDITYHHNGVTIYLPIVTMLLLSILLSIILSLVVWWLGRGR